MLHRIVIFFVCALAVIPLPFAHAQDLPAALTTATRLNMRSGPGDNYSIIAKLPYGTRVTLHGRSANSRWALVEAEAGRGWVSTYYLEPDAGVQLSALPVAGATAATTRADSAAPAGANTAATTVNLRMREGPSEEDEIIAVLPKGTVITLGSRSGDGNWVRAAAADGLSGWVSTCCISVVAPPAAPASPPAAAGDSAQWPLSVDFITVGSRTRAIYLRGLAMGRNPHVFIKMGDCNVQTAFLFAFFDRGEYNLAEFAYLQPVIDHYRGSFVRDSLTVWSGGAAFMPFDTLLSNPSVCERDETPLDCEIRLQNPSVAVIAFGQNDGPSFADDLRKLVKYTVDQGIVPILSTKANVPGESAEYKNGVIRQVAAEYGVPLWDWGKVADAAPPEKLWDASGHLLWYPMYYNDSNALFMGHSLHNLTGLIALYTVWQQALY
ncbi:MAG: SH3 domain-containing protein [Anaerolineae bacterium]|nr:SH3 domain-containing protein [Anaerolineae bacterium]